MKAPPPLLAVTMGDPAGIGAEVVVKAATVPDVRRHSRLVIYGDLEILRRTASDAGMDLVFREVQRPEEARALDDSREVAVRAVSRLGSDDVAPGRPSIASDRAQLEYVRAAFDDVRSNQAAAIVTAPIRKAALIRTHHPWPGHTEMLADWCGVATPHMMLVGPTLKVVPLTIHVPLAKVPSLLTPELVERGITVTYETLRVYFARHTPRIAVAGLNPHAGEDGLFGREEIDSIAPGVEAAKRRGITVTGPLPADTVYHRTVSGEFDAVIGMYHDQALIPLKLLDFDYGVNVTIGLPVIRTSVDHGTAYDIAGRGIASASSMIAALRLAADMAGARRTDAAVVSAGRA